jgi:hypothetical protein
MSTHSQLSSLAFASLNYRLMPSPKTAPYQIIAPMKNPELLVQFLHLLTMRPLIPALLAIPRLLMLPQPHDLSRLRTHVNKVEQRCNKHCGEQICVGLVMRSGSEQGARVREP